MSSPHHPSPQLLAFLRRHLSPNSATLFRTASPETVAQIGFLVTPIAPPPLALEASTIEFRSAIIDPFQTPYLILLGAAFHFPSTTEYFVMTLNIHGYEALTPQLLGELAIQPHLPIIWGTTPQHTHHRTIANPLQQFARQNLTFAKQNLHTWTPQQFEEARKTFFHRYPSTQALWTHLEPLPTDPPSPPFRSPLTPFPAKKGDKRFRLVQQETEP